MVPLFLSDADFALIPMLGAYHSHAGNVSLPCLERISPMLGMVRPSHTEQRFIRDEHLENGVIGCRSVFHGSCLLYKT
jgi:hypothetical protein